MKYQKHGNANFKPAFIPPAKNAGNRNRPGTNTVWIAEKLNAQNVNNQSRDHFSQGKFAGFVFEREVPNDV